MKIQTNTYSSFPSQVVSDEEKASLDYGIQVGRAIEQEWFQGGRSGNRYAKYYSNFHQLRLYARGEQSVQKYKNELSIVDIFTAIKIVNIDTNEIIQDKSNHFMWINITI